MRESGCGRSDPPAPGSQKVIIMEFAFQRGDAKADPEHSAAQNSGVDEQKAIVSGRSSRESEVPETVGEPFSGNPRMTCRRVNVFYGDKHAIREVSLDIAQNEVISMIGPSGCGKSLPHMIESIPVSCRSSASRLGMHDAPSATLR